MLAADITGSWTLQVDLGGQGGSPKMTFQQKGDKVEFQFETGGITVGYAGTIISASD